MKQKIAFCCLLLLFIVTGLGCFSATEWLLGCTEKEKGNVPEGSCSTPVVQEVVTQTVVVVVEAPLVIDLSDRWWGPGSWWRQYGYQHQHLPSWHHWWLHDTRGRCWWMDYCTSPELWPRPRLRLRLGPRVERLPRVRAPVLKQIIKRRTMIPRDTKSGIDRYVDHGVPTGSFLHAVLSNDLFEAVARADDDNKRALGAICEYIYNYTPNTCHGSPEEVITWLKFHRETAVAANLAASSDREQREHYYELEDRLAYE